MRGVERLKALRRSRPRLIVDRALRLGDFHRTDVGYDVSLAKEEVARHYVLEREGTGLRFLDVGARDARLDYLLGVERNLRFDEGLWKANHERFTAKYEYYGLDLAPEVKEHVLTGTSAIRRSSLSEPEYGGFFDVVYSNNIFEHQRRPRIAAEKHR
jgi:hypothetical protein